MNISDVNTSTHRSDQLTSSSVGPIDPTASGRAVSEETTESKADRVEISDKARQALQSARSTEDLTFARNALNNVPEMSDERTARIADRIKSGYYNSPEVLQTIAERLAARLSGEAL